MPGESNILAFDERIRVAAAQGLLQRMVLARRMGQSFDGQRDLYTILGYDRELTLDGMLERYARGGIAGRIVDALPYATWRGGVELVEDNKSEQKNAFEQAWADLAKRLRLVSKMQKADILSRLSSFSVLLLGTGDGDFQQELPRGAGPDDLLYVQQYIGAYVPRITNDRRTRSLSVSLGQLGMGEATIKAYDEDPKSPRYGQPLIYELRRQAFGGDAQPKTVHWSRVIHVADGLEDDLFGPPALERVWNLLDDLLKVTGGGAEAFFQRANQGRNISVDPATGKLGEDEKAAIREQLELLDLGYGKNIFTRGVDVQTFGSDVANFNNPADAVLTQLSGATGIPKRILTGSEMGELASSQDRENWRDQVNGRREQHAFPNILQKLTDRLIAYSYLPTPKQYEARWGKVLNRTEQEQWAAVTTMVAAKTDEGPAFTRDEIRAEAGKDPLAPEQQAAIDEALAAKAERAQAAAPQFVRAAEEGETVALLEEAIRAKNLDVIAEIVGC